MLVLALLHNHNVLQRQLTVDGGPCQANPIRAQNKQNWPNLPQEQDMMRRLCTVGRPGSHPAPIEYHESCNMIADI